MIDVHATLAGRHCDPHKPLLMAFVEPFHLASPHPAARPFLIGAAILFLLGLLVAHWLAWLAFVCILLLLYFFRDPERVAPDRDGVLLAPADGRVVSVAATVPPADLGLGTAPRWRIATFLSVLDVHVNRIPADGTITRIAYRHGRFRNAADRDAAATNEHNAITIRLADGREIAVVQIAGLIARRIVCSVREGDAVVAGTRFGIIRFGSRTDLYLPEGVPPLVAEGQTMVGGETVVAHLER